MKRVLSGCSLRPNQKELVMRRKAILALPVRIFGLRGLALFCMCDHLAEGEHMNDQEHNREYPDLPLLVSV
jgi:hypothetical protein